MDLQTFRNTLKAEQPPAGITTLLQALWYDGKGKWERAHDIAKDIHTSDGSWVHAYLHRKEGDDSNASYWYAKAGKNTPSDSLEKEWERLVTHFLDTR